MILTVTMNPAIDLSLEVPDWEVGEVNRATSTLKTIGGKGINVSRALRELGTETSVLTVIGSNSIQEFQRIARGVGFPIVYINIPGEVRTNIHITDPKTSRSLKVNQSGASFDAKSFEHFRLLFRQQLRQAKYVSFGGSLPPGADVDIYGILASIAKEHSVPALIDAMGEPLMQALRSQPFIVKPNRSELEQTIDRPLNTLQDTIQAAREIHEKGAYSVVVSDGADPMVALWGNEGCIVYPPKIDVLGPTGAGDSLTAGLLSGLSQGKPFPESLALGVAAAAACCIRPEGELGKREDMDRLLHRIKWEML